MKVLIVDNYDSFTYNLYQAVGEVLEEVCHSGAKRSEAIESPKVQERSYRGLQPLQDDNVVDVVRNDEITLDKIQKRRYDRIILSPGPGNPADRKYFGVCADILQQVKTIPILGVCLGMQGIAHYFEGKVIRAQDMTHGKTSVIVHDGKGIFGGVPQSIKAMRYHSLVVEAESLPECLEVTAGVCNLSSRAQSRDLIQKPSGTSLREISPLTAFGRNDTTEIMGIRHKTLPIEGVQFHPESFATEAGNLLLQNFLFGQVLREKTAQGILDKELKSMNYELRR